MADEKMETVEREEGMEPVADAAAEPETWTRPRTRSPIPTA